MSELWILTEHPDLKGPPVRRTLESFNNLYAEKGWVLVDESTDVAKLAPTLTRAEAMKSSKSAKKDSSTTKKVAKTT